VLTRINTVYQIILSFILFGKEAVFGIAKPSCAEVYLLILQDQVSKGEEKRTVKKMSVSLNLSSNKHGSNGL
jgi:hypothetical protein